MLYSYFLPYMAESHFASVNVMQVSESVRNDIGRINFIDVNVHEHVTTAKQLMNVILETNVTPVGLNVSVIMPI